MVLEALTAGRSVFGGLYGEWRSGDNRGMSLDSVGDFIGEAKETIRVRGAQMTLGEYATACAALAQAMAAVQILDQLIALNGKADELT